MIETMYMNDMDERQRTMFLAEFSQKRKEVTAGILLALFLGAYGGHRFYLGQKQLGIAYLCYTLLSILFCFFLIGVPMLIVMQVVCIVECFMMPERVRAYNSQQAGLISAQVKALTAAPAPPVPPPAISSASALGGETAVQPTE